VKRLGPLLLLIGLPWLSGCAALFFHPEKAHYLDPADHGIGYEDVWLDSEDGTRLHGWLLPAINEPRLSLLFLQGNAQNISAHIAAVYWLPNHAIEVFLADYRGFGKSEGRPSFSGVHSDARAALKWLAQRSARNDTPLAVFGQSLGGALAIHTVATSGHEIGVCAIVADSPFSSYRGIAQEKFAEFWLTWPLQVPLSWLISDRYAPIDRVAEISPIPLLLLAGDEDRVVPPHHAKALYAAAEPPVELRQAEGMGHTQLLRIEGEPEYLVDWLITHCTAGESAVH